MQTPYLVLPFVNGVIVSRKKILIGRTPMSRNKAYPGYWDLPGGKMEKLETPEDCLIRELREELCIVVELSRQPLAVFHRNSVTRLSSCANDTLSLGICYVVTGFQGEIVPTEQEEVHYASLEEIVSLYEKITPWSRVFIDRYLSLYTNDPLDIVR